MIPQEIIKKKRDGGELSSEELHWFIREYSGGNLPDYQMAALAMAIFFRGMTFAETEHLTREMLESGVVLDHASIPGMKLDKHSTGGIGDKVSLILAPMIACCGIVVPMVSGRGLGHTGGTLDKLESIPGYTVSLGRDAFSDILRAVGCAIVGSTEEMAPADAKLYALRDVTATVDSLPLICASIMSKKLAEGIDGLVLDIKVGTGAFLKEIDQARELGKTMVEVGKRMGKKMAAVISDMNQPLGDAVGNALEVVESCETLLGRGPADLEAITLKLGALMLQMGGVAAGEDEAVEKLRATLDDGSAFRRFQEMVRAQGGNPTVLEDYTLLPTADTRTEITAPETGYVGAIDGEGLGIAILSLGAGRTRVGDPIDPTVGLTGIRRIGDPVEKGAPLCTLHHCGGGDLPKAEDRLRRSFRIVSDRVDPPELIREVLV